MLTALSIRDVVLIERLDLRLDSGLTVLTGETGAGKSILLDSLGMALGARVSAELIRHGAPQAVVAANFSPAPDHPVHALLCEQGLDGDEELVLRRVVTQEGRSRATINDQPVSAGLLRRVGALLVEVQGQHDQMGLADQATHAALLDAHGVDPDLRAEVAGLHRAWRAAVERVVAERAAIAEARREEDWLRHAVDELSTLAPLPDEDERLAADRARLQKGERRAEAIAAAAAELTPRERRNAGPAAALRAASRALSRLLPREGEPDAELAPALASLERAEEALAEAEALLSRLAEEAEADPRRIEAVEERLFALRAGARKHGVPVSELPALLTSLRERLDRLVSGTERLAAGERDAVERRARYIARAEALAAARREVATGLERAVGRELAPLKLDRARFVVAIETLPEADWGPGGMERVAFLVATNPGQPPGPLGRVASGGELSRLMLALKVVLAAGSTIGTLVFDEVDSGVGGATAAAVGDRLARLAAERQVLVVTHSPQVAARGDAHWQVMKLPAKGRAETRVASLDGGTRREEIARMLAGEVVTEAARAAADSLLAK